MPPPPAAAAAAQTTELLLSNNAFTGDVPEQYAALSGAKSIDLRHNNLTNNAGVPPWLSLDECVFWVLCCRWVVVVV